MPLRFEVTFGDKASGQTYVAEGKFSDEEADILNRYVDACDRLADSRRIQEGMWSTLHVSMRTPNEVSTTATLPDWDDVIVVLHKYRLIGLQSESTFFGRVANILGKNIQVPYFPTILGRLRAKFSGDDFRSVIQITSNGTVVNTEQVMNAWLNAYEYHQDDVKKAFVDDLHHLVPLDSTKAIFLQLLAERIEAALILAAQTRVVLGRETQLELQV